MNQEVADGQIIMESSFQSLAKRLADNDAKVRAKSLKELSTRIKSIESNISTLEMMKIWKGFFYCLWMSDKRQVQNDLSERLAALTSSLRSTDLSLLFIECFWRTIMREWSGIDYLRLDKFYHLCRSMLVSTGDFLSINNYNLDILEKFSDILATYPLNPEFGKCPRAITYFVCENYLLLFSETGKVPSVMDKIELFGPVFNLILSTDESLILDKLASGIFDPIFGEGSEDEEKFAWSDEDLVTLATAMLMLMDDEGLSDSSVNRLNKFLRPLAERFGGIESLLLKINGPDNAEVQDHEEDLEAKVEAEDVEKLEAEVIDDSNDDVPALIPMKKKTTFGMKKQVKEFNKHLPSSEIEKEEVYVEMEGSDSENYHHRHHSNNNNNTYNKRRKASSPQRGKRNKIRVISKE